MSNSLSTSPIAIVTSGFEELGAAVQKLDRTALRKFNMGIPQRIQLLQAAAKEAPDQAHIVNRILVPSLKAQSTIARAAENAAAQRRVKDSADLLDTATHIVPISADAVATATTITAEIKTPFSGQPWRYLDLFAACSASVAVRLSSFKLTSIDHVVTDNITYSTAPSDKGIDLAQFVGSNQQAAKPRMQWRPWGLKRSGVIRPEGIITLAVSNRTGAAAYWYLGLMIQASPCGEDASYADGRDGVYTRKDHRSRAFFKKLMNLSLFG